MCWLSSPILVFASGLKTVGLILVDEAHHYASPRYRDVIESLQRDDTLLLGVSATLMRMDGEDLSAIFHETVYCRDIAEMIREGHLPATCSIPRPEIYCDIPIE